MQSHVELLLQFLVAGMVGVQLDSSEQVVFGVPEPGLPGSCRCAPQVPQLPVSAAPQKHCLSAAQKKCKPGANGPLRVISPFVMDQGRRQEEKRGKSVRRAIVVELSVTLDWVFNLLDQPVHTLDGAAPHFREQIATARWKHIQMPRHANFRGKGDRIKGRKRSRRRSRCNQWHSSSRSKTTAMLQL